MLKDYTKTILSLLSIPLCLILIFVVFILPTTVEAKPATPTPTPSVPSSFYLHSDWGQNMNNNQTILLGNWQATWLDGTVVYSDGVFTPIDPVRKLVLTGYCETKFGVDRLLIKVRVDSGIGIMDNYTVHDGNGIASFVLPLRDGRPFWIEATQTSNSGSNTRIKCAISVERLP